MSKTCLLTAWLLIPAAPALAQTAQAPQTTTILGQQFRAGTGAGAPTARGGKLAGLLTPQQRAAFLLQIQEETRGMTPDQRKARRREETRKLLTMSATDRQQFIAQLQARWDGLPERRKARLQQRMAARTQGQ